MGVNRKRNCLRIGKRRRIKLGRLESKTAVLTQKNGRFNMERALRHPRLFARVLQEFMGLTLNVGAVREPPLRDMPITPRNPKDPLPELKKPNGYDDERFDGK